MPNSRRTAPYEALVTAVLAWQNPSLTSGDFEQTALQLTGHARAAAAGGQRHAAALPTNDVRGALADILLRRSRGTPLPAGPGHRLRHPEPCQTRAIPL
ncbi:hypothetical protein [Streptomyces sp. YU58]|uniref:hypothetical protein n=1 Tax=Streptomyces sp. SX92 TaxID=3158972 RepID=UPI0027B8D134|nr:hypothetical protein [Streptomyces coralus]